MGGGSTGGDLYRRIRYFLPHEASSSDEPSRPCALRPTNPGTSPGLPRVVEVTTAAGVRRPLPGMEAREDENQSVLDYMQSYVSRVQLRLRLTHQDDPAGSDVDASEALPFDLWGGFVGYLTYEMGRECDVAQPAPWPSGGR